MKKNLAKVLGMEEFDQASAPAPSEDQVVQQQIEELSQHIQQTNEATDVALESIGNALQLQSIIEQNNSTDKTTYDVLRVAVEQLKERTGVYTSSVSLEDISPLNYRTEGIEDIKKFAVKVWETIKKALAAMWEKIKGFFNTLFDKEKIVKKEAEEAVKEAEEFEKEEADLPKNEQQSNSYKSDYFTKSKPLELGYTPNTPNTVNVKEDKGFNTGEKQPKNSNKVYGDLAKEKVSNFKYSKIVVRFLGTNRLYDSVITDIKDQLKKLFNEDMLDVSEMLKILEKVEKDDFRLDNVSIGKITPAMGKQSILVKVEENRAKVEFVDLNNPDHLRLHKPGWIYENLLKHVNDCFNILNGYEKKYLSDQNKVSQEIDKLRKSIDHNVDYNQEKYHQIQVNINRFISYISSFAIVFAEIKKYMIGLTKAITTLLRETLTFYKVHYANELNSKGFITQMNILKDLGYIES